MLAIELVEPAGEHNLICLNHLAQDPVLEQRALESIGDATALGRLKDKAVGLGLDLAKSESRVAPVRQLRFGANAPSNGTDLPPSFFF